MEEQVDGRLGRNTHAVAPPRSDGAVEQPAAPSMQSSNRTPND